MSEAVAGLPQEFRDMLENVDVVVEDFPTRLQSRKTSGKGGCSAFMRVCR